MTDSMRVLACFTDPRMGGPGARAIPVADRLSDRNVDVDFLIPTGDDDFADAARDIGATVHRMRIPRLRSPRRLRENVRFVSTLPKKIRGVRQLIDSEGYDLVHVNTPYNFQPAIGTARSSATLVWHFNDVLTPWPVNSIAGSLANRYADGIGISCDSAIEYFGLDSDTIVPLYPPVDLEEFDPENYPEGRRDLRSELDVDPSTFLIGAIGNINPVKGFDVLIDAFAAVHERQPDSKLVIAGSELDSQRGYAKRVRSKIRTHDLESAVEFLGWRSDIPRILSGLDLLVVSSRSETGPMVALEAMAMECPVVSTRVGAVAEQAVDGRHLWLVDPEDVPELEAAILDAISATGNTDRLTARARELVEENFSLDSLVESHLQLYEVALDD
ncbi:glycosyltransferase family 4 protein [Halostella salina]|uniref:glycosyltransferase family 4 protein n=1 Tax=Halostella salina TaxID=1547897 RepID=UPI0013CE90BB|nr:glycosyltransferase family 4 protein [Halostella salina]